MIPCKEFGVDIKGKKMEINRTALSKIKEKCTKKNNSMEKYYRYCPCNIPDVACVPWPQEVHTFPVCYRREGRRICGKRRRTNPTMPTSLHLPMNTQRVPGNNQTPNNTVIAPAVSDALSLSASHNKSLFDRPVRYMCSTGGSLLLLLNTKLYY